MLRSAVLFCAFALHSGGGIPGGADDSVHVDFGVVGRRSIEYDLTCTGVALAPALRAARTWNEIIVATDRPRFPTDVQCLTLCTTSDVVVLESLSVLIPHRRRTRNPES